MRKSLASTIKKALACLMACLAAASLCACGKGVKPAPAETPAPSLSPEATAAPEQGGILRMPIPVNAPRSDPMNVNTKEMLYLFSLIYEPLLNVGPAGELEPCLCESWVSEGNGLWLLRLREGVRWHDGSALKTEDVISSYNALAAMEGGHYKPCLTHITGMSAAGPSSLRVQFDIPGMAALYALSFPIKKAAPMMGTGSYMLEYSDDNSVILRVNENWWDRRPYIDRIIFEERDNNTTALASFEAGQFDLVPTDILTAGRYFESGVSNVFDIMTQGMETLMFNDSAAALKDVRIRLAIAHAIDRTRIITNVYSNRARAADVPFAPDNWLYDTRSAVFNYDPDVSKELIAEAGYTVMSKEGLLYSKAGGNLYVRLLTSATTDNTVRSDAAAVIAENLTEIGFMVEIVTAPHTLGDPESEFVKALAEGNWEIALVGFNLGFGCELSDYLEPEGANNYGHFSIPETSALAKALMNAENEEDLREAAYTFQGSFVENVPFITLYFRLNSLICSAALKGTENAREPYLFANEKDWYLKKAQ